MQPLKLKESLAVVENLIMCPLSVHAEELLTTNSCHAQYGYLIKGKPDNLSLFSEFYLNREKQRFAHKSYTQWVIDRAMTFDMPYTLPRTRKIHVKGEYKKKDRDYDTVMGLLEEEVWEGRKIIVKMRKSIEVKDAILDRVPGSKKRRMDLFDGPYSDFVDKFASGA
ncbi:hypothetical protein MTR_4g048680 [Medicago truncatula]|uniref:Uncharacterized protein n=1 Tax=Medicago truncatula TaxID=3880 RepID=A0A072UJV0_MEDTR|nr:hypothetical protein MTR_4g048680 [Medicago truncatula]